jgi:glycosyltransferase involved in cell wall biosynthesis
MEERMLVEVEERKFIADEAVSVGAKPFVVVGIPAFNEEHTIARVVLEAKRFADAVVVCDDGSSDLTGKIAKHLGADVVRHEENLGYGAALRSLFSRARELEADVLVTLDADGQHDPREVPVIVAPVIDGSGDVVVGSRFVNGRGSSDMPFYRRFGAKMITRMVNGSTSNISDAQSGFRAYGREALERLGVSESGMGASVELLLEARKSGLKVCEVACSCRYQNGGVSTSTVHPVRHGLDVVMSVVRFIVEEKPLLALGIPGLMCLFLGTGFGVWMLQIYSITHSIVTNVALASLAFVLIGFFMLSTSITLYAISRIRAKS